MITMLEKPNKDKIDTRLIKINKVTNKAEIMELISIYDIREYDSSGLYYEINFNKNRAGFVKLINYNKDRFIKGYELKEYIVDGLGDKNTIEISLLYINEEYRCMGIGEYIVNWIKDLYYKRRIVLYTLIEAEEFWISQHFKIYSFPLIENPEISYSEYVYYFE